MVSVLKFILLFPSVFVFDEKKFLSLSVGEDTIERIIALRAKVYAYKTKSGHIGKRAKGTTHDAQDLQLDWEQFEEALSSLKTASTTNLQFIRKTFKVSTVLKDTTIKYDLPQCGQFCNWTRLLHVKKP